MKNILIIFTLCAMLFAPAVLAQDFGIYDLSTKTNLDSTDALMLSQASDSTYYKVLWDRIVDSVEDSINGQITNTWIKSGAAIALNKLASGTSAYFIVNNGSGVPTYVAMSGDATLANTGAVTLAAGSVGTSEITNGVIIDEDINAAAGIAISKLATGTAAYIIVNNSGGVPTYVAMTGDATISNAGVVTIAANAITSAEITDNTITSSDILDGTIATGDILDGTIVTADISNGTIINEDLSASAAIALSKLETGTAAYIIVNNAGGVPTYVAMSGDATITNAGVVDLADALSDNFAFSGTISNAGVNTFNARVVFNEPTVFKIDSLGYGAETASIDVSILGQNIIIYGADDAPLINGFTNGYSGQKITIICHPSTYTTVGIDNNSTIKLAGGVDYNMGPYDVLNLVNYGGVWVETGRSNN